MERAHQPMSFQYASQDWVRSFQHLIYRKLIMSGKNKNEEKKFLTIKKMKNEGIGKN